MTYGLAAAAASPPFSLLLSRLLFWGLESPRRRRRAGMAVAHLLACGARIYTLNPDLPYRITE